MQHFEVKSGDCVAIFVETRHGPNATDRLLQPIQARIQPRFVPGSGVLMQNAFLDSFIQGRSRLAEGLSGCSLVTLGKRLTHVAES